MIRSFSITLVDTECWGERWENMDEYSDEMLLVEDELVR
jgi:hypothetical protein